MGCGEIATKMKKASNNWKLGRKESLANHNGGSRIFENTKETLVSFYYFYIFEVIALM